MATAYCLLSSTRWDPFLLTLRWNRCNDEPCPFLLLHYHHQRLLGDAALHGWSSMSLTYDTLLSSCSHAVEEFNSKAEQQPAALKIRITLSEAGDLQVTASPVPPYYSDPTDASFFNPSDSASRFAPLRTLIPDTQATRSSLFTVTKTTNRAVYDDARVRVASLSDAASPSPNSADTFDVMLYNSEGQITETSIFNVAFFRGRSRSRWVTPTAATGCLPGVMRRWLLEQGRIREAKEEDGLTRDSIQPGEWVLLFNGVQGCRLGRMVGN